LDVGILKTLPGTYGGHEGAAVWYAVDCPDQGVGTAAEASLVLSREDHDVVVPAHFCEGSALATSETLPDHERSALDPKWVDCVVKVWGPESRLKACHDGMLRGHNVIDLTGIVAVVAAIGGSKMTGRERPVLVHEIGPLGEIEEVRSSSDRDEGFLAEILIEQFVLGLLEVHKTKGENQKVSPGKVLGEIRELVWIYAAV
tara:strand:+ start:403 stop:1005 length:603 start_codon:yes stop_codon:yes gene_type:complete